MGDGEVNGEAPRAVQPPATVAWVFARDRAKATRPWALRTVLCGLGFAMAMMAISVLSHALGTYPFRGWVPMALNAVGWAAVWTPVYGFWLARRTPNSDPEADHR